MLKNLLEESLSDFKCNLSNKQYNKYLNKYYEIDLCEEDDILTKALTDNILHIAEYILDLSNNYYGENSPSISYNDIILNNYKCGLKIKIKSFPFFLQKISINENFTSINKNYDCLDNLIEDLKKYINIVEINYNDKVFLTDYINFKIFTNSANNFVTEDIFCQNTNEISLKEEIKIVKNKKIKYEEYISEHVNSNKPKILENITINNLDNEIYGICEDCLNKIYKYIKYEKK